MGNEVFLLLKFSYDSLPNDDIKACLLRFALHQETSEITTCRIIGKCFAEGLLSEHDSIDDYENHGYDIIGTLLSMRLLGVLAEDERNVRLHNVVRDMVLWVASECGKWKDTHLIEAGLRLRKIPEVGKWNNARVLSTMHNLVEEIIEEPLSPNLEALYLGHYSLSKITPAFFSSMCTLRVLDLSHNNGSLRELPWRLSAYSLGELKPGVYRNQATACWAEELGEADSARHLGHITDVCDSWACAVELVVFASAEIG